MTKLIFLQHCSQKFLETCLLHKKLLLRISSQQSLPKIDCVFGTYPSQNIYKEKKRFTKAEVADSTINSIKLKFSNYIQFLIFTKYLFLYWQKNYLLYFSGLSPETLFPCCGYFMENILGKSPENLQKLCFTTKFLHKEVR